MVNLYLAEDQAMLNSALTTILNLEPDLTVIGTAMTGTAAWQEINQLRPDLAILDIELPGESGLMIAQQIDQGELSTKTLILTTFAQSAYLQQALAAKVNGYLLKDSPSAELVSGIRAIMAGQTVYAPELVRGMYAASQNPLTPREMEVLMAAASGETTGEIAQQVSLSEGTVRNYFSAILSKLGARNRLDAVQLAQANKWL
ncbi:response regulator [Furfurilactobacillus curtus]|uniref:DNA-binding response regulator n=1 Tax=Furfurilactobacillus curtus TaxID=1746200 RepID=A0ABQ5JPF8_9LACO